jgi:hypothetical protein
LRGAAIATGIDENIDIVSRARWPFRKALTFLGAAVPARVAAGTTAEVIKKE